MEQYFNGHGENSTPEHENIAMPAPSPNLSPASRGEKRNESLRVFHVKYQRGLTLPELLIAMVILIILVSVTLPIYQHVILKVRRAEARGALHAVMLQQERFYTQHNTYKKFTADTKNTLFKWWSGDTPENSYYEISATPCPSKSLNQCVLLTATSGTDNVKQVDDPVCGNLMLDSTNNKTYSLGTEPNSLCW